VSIMTPKPAPINGGQGALKNHLRAEASLSKKADHISRW
jgi:hypothetical protein